MFDLNGFLSLLDEIEEKRRISVVPMFRPSVGIDAPGLRPRQKPGPKPRPGKSARSGKPRTGGKPLTGSTLQGVLEEERRKRRGGGGGSGGARRSEVSASSLRPATAPSPAGAVGAPGSRQMIIQVGPQVRAAIAAGSQPAVVKLVSFAAGRSRITALLSYQSRAGKVSVEDEAGLTQDGNAWVQAIADDWSEDDGRQPSKDVLRLSLSIPVFQVRADDDLSVFLKQTLPGHRMAWRSEVEGDRRHIELVMSAAARKQPGEIRPSRIFDNRKSLALLEARFNAVFGDDAEIEVQGFAHGVEGVARFLGQIRKGGRHDLRSSRLGRSGSFTDDVVLTGPKAAIEEARAWKRDLRSQERRDVAHIVLSAKPGTPKEGFVAAARAMLAREFEGHAYVFALHEDRDHLHVHAVVKMRSETGKKLHPKIQDFKRWRETLAEEARQRDIPMDAVSRFERANPPGYTMKDIRRVERGEATERVRRRVEAVRNGDVHLPTRKEGRLRAEHVARSWSDMSGTTSSSTLTPEPPQRPGYTRLYRAERSGAQSLSASSAAPLFTLDRASAAQMVLREGGMLRYLDVPSSELHRLDPSRSQPDTVFVVPRDLASQAQTIGAVPPADIIRFSERAALAAASGAHRSTITSTLNQKDNDMADLRLMRDSFKEMDDNLDQIVLNLPEERAKQIKSLRDKVTNSQRIMLGAQEAIEKKRGKIAGETFVTPQPIDLQDFVAEKRGELLRYNHRKADGGSGSVAFTDHGDKVEISNWNDRETVLAAMQVASTKWGSLTINGTDRYKALAIELAAEHGFQITNPELQSSLQAAREQFSSRREKAGIVAGTLAERQQDVQSDPQTIAEKPTANQAVLPSKPINDGTKARSAEQERDAMLAAMREAQAKYGVIAVNGTERDKALAVEIAAENGLTLTNPELQEKLTEARQRIEERRQKEVERERKPIGFDEGTSDRPSLRKTEAEIEIGLAVVRERTETEARREVRQAATSVATNERPFDGGGEDHAYRTKSEASAAVRAERSIEQSVDKPMSPDINQSQEIVRERDAQEALLAERQANKDEKVQKQAERQKPKQRQ
ncbi:Relaxase/Mobilisation nuclease domain-containing protein [Ensifer adhaerens]|nr:Relaxase/Mobilisation nuclease domain-containing protein [Ensifer adhaerens]